MKLFVLRKPADCGVALAAIFALKPRRLVVVVVIVVKFFGLTFVFVSVV